jgi:hypothetical protein
LTYRGPRGDMNYKGWQEDESSRRVRAARQPSLRVHRRRDRVRGVRRAACHPQSRPSQGT